MNSILGFVDYFNKEKNAKEIISTMLGKEIDIAKSNATIYSDNMKTFKSENITYKIVFTGEIYNTCEAIEILRKNSILLDDKLSDEEIIIKLYSIYKEECLNYLKGVFSFCIFEEKKDIFFIARDHFGVKPLFYTVKDGILIFSSDIKKIFKYPGVRAILDKSSIAQLFGLSPARILGSGIFKNINEVKPGHFLIYTKEGLVDNAYFRLNALNHKDSNVDTITKVKQMIEKFTIENINKSGEVATFLSGGIDSSILTAIAAKNAKKYAKKIKTFSVDYVDNDKNFKASAFQPARDNYYIDLVSKKYNTNHEYILLDTNDLVDNLREVILARGLPSMADVDSSLYAFSKKVKEKCDVVLSGEFADEVFGGYPWFYREDSLKSGTFPWSIALCQRQSLMNDCLKEKIDIVKYVDSIYKEELKNVPILESFSDEEKQMRKLQYLTLYYFGETLIDRTERMSNISNLNIRVPFINYELVQYVYNIPWSLKNYNNMEKGILREAFKDYLPEEIKNRKKSPYPKTYNPSYLQAVKMLLLDILNNKNEPIHNLIDEKFVRQIIETDGNAFTRPWFGQLMTGPQLIAYLVQLNIWLKELNIEIDL